MSFSCVWQAQPFCLTISHQIEVLPKKVVAVPKAIAPLRMSAIKKVPNPEEISAAPVLASPLNKIDSNQAINPLTSTLSPVPLSSYVFVPFYFSASFLIYSSHDSTLLCSLSIFIEIPEAILFQRVRYF